MLRSRKRMTMRGLQIYGNNSASSARFYSRAWNQHVRNCYSTLLAPIARPFSSILVPNTQVIFFPKETEVNNRLSVSSHRHSCLVTDHFHVEGGWQIWKQNSYTACAEEIKIVHNDTKQRNTSQASEIKLWYKAFSRENKFLQKKLPFPSPPIKFPLLTLASPTQWK